MLGDATITVTKHTRLSTLHNWVSRVVSTQHIKGVYEGQFASDTVNVYYDPWGSVLTMIEVDVAFHAYASEE